MDNKKIFWIVTAVLGVIAVAAAVACFVSRCAVKARLAGCDEYIDCDFVHTDEESETTETEEGPCAE